MPQTKPKEQAIREAIELLISQGRDVTSAAILAWLHGDGIKAKPSDIHDSAVWKELVAKEKGKTTEAAPAKKAETKRKEAPTPKETPMAKTEQKPKFPSKPCPKCGQFIHIKKQKHEACGWGLDAETAPTATEQPAKKRGRPKKDATVPTARSTVGGISLADIVAVKALAEKLGAEKLRQLAEVLAK